MAGPWIDTPALRQRVADVLAVDVAELGDTYARLVPDANLAAANDISGRLLARGFTQAQVDAWCAAGQPGQAFNLDLGVFWVMAKARAAGRIAAGLQYGDRDPLDRRAELTTVPILIGGVLAVPGAAAGSGGGASGGRLSEAGYRFTLSEPF